MSGCLDHQTSGDTGNGGIFTHSMFMAMEDLQKQGLKEYSAGKLYNVTLEKDRNAFDSKQDICMQCAPGVEPGMIKWPLVPKEKFKAPYKKRGRWGW